MAFSTIFCRASKSLKPLGIRATQSAKTTPSVKALNFHDGRISLLPRYFFSSKAKPDADTSTEAAQEKEKILENKAIDIPGSHFVVEESPEDEDHTLSLKRTYKNEKITVKFLKYPLETGMDSVRAKVTIDKNSSINLNFLLDVSDDSIKIKNIGIVTKPSPNFERTDFSWGLGEDMEKAFLSYLDTRGIKPSLVTGLLNVMTKRSNSVSWLTDLKSFMEM